MSVRTEGELTEKQIEALGPWLGCFLEKSSTLTICMTGARAYPQFQFCDEGHPQKHRILRKKFGGSFTPQERPERYLLSGVRVVRIAEAAEKYAPGRSTVIQKIKKWEQADMEGRLELQRSIKSERLFLPADKDTYKELLKLPGFAAVLVDDGYPYPNLNQMSSRFYPKHLVITHNLPLLEAAAESFSGKLNIRAHKGEVVEFDGKKVTLENDTYQLMFGSAASRRLFNFVQDDLLFNKPLVKALLKI